MTLKSASLSVFFFDKYLQSFIFFLCIKTLAQNENRMTMRRWENETNLKWIKKTTTTYFLLLIQMQKKKKKIQLYWTQCVEHTINEYIFMNWNEREWNRTVCVSYETCALTDCLWLIGWSGEHSLWKFFLLLYWKSKYYRVEGRIAVASLVCCLQQQQRRRQRRRRRWNSNNNTSTDCNSR